MSNYNYYNLKELTDLYVRNEYPNGMVDKTIWTNLLRIGTKIHRSEQNRIFLLKCQNKIAQVEKLNHMSFLQHSITYFHIGKRMRRYRKYPTNKKIP